MNDTNYSGVILVLIKIYCDVWVARKCSTRRKNGFDDFDEHEMISKQHRCQINSISATFEFGDVVHVVKCVTADNGDEIKTVDVGMWAVDVIRDELHISCILLFIQGIVVKRA